MASTIDFLRERCRSVLSGEVSQGELDRELRDVSDASGLRELAYEFPADWEVSVPVFNRLIELEPQNATAIADLGFVYWLGGFDDVALEKSTLSLAIDPVNIQALLLKTAMLPLKERESAYSRILELDPGNLVALENLKVLRAET